MIQSWRGMKILEQLDQIEEGTLSACWTVAQRNISNNDKRHLDKLSEQVGGHEKLQVILNEVLSSTPSVEELTAMLTILYKEKVGIDIWEVKKEMKIEQIKAIPLIETIEREAEERIQKNKDDEDESTKPLPREESLRTFFGDLGIDNFVNGCGVGAYGMDWGHVELKNLDYFAKRESLSEYSPKGCYLECTPRGPDTKERSFGRIANPQFVAKDDTKYTFLYAKFQDGRFHIKTKVKKIGKDSFTSTYTIQELRELIGVPLSELVIEEKSLPPKSFFSRIASFFG